MLALPVPGSGRGRDPVCPLWWGPGRGSHGDTRHSPAMLREHKKGFDEAFSSTRALMYNGERAAELSSAPR